MMDVDNLWIPFLPRTSQDSRLDHVKHICVAVVIVSYVLLVEPGHRRNFIGCTDVGAIPIRDHGLTIGIQ